MERSDGTIVTAGFVKSSLLSAIPELDCGIPASPQLDNVPEMSFMGGLCSEE
jgi:hypothetical protein